MQRFAPGPQNVELTGGAFLPVPGPIAPQRQRCGPCRSLHKPEGTCGHQDQAQGIRPDHALALAALVLPKAGEGIAITEGDFYCPPLAILREDRLETQREVGGGRVGKLERAEQQLLFVLVYTKAYRLQVVLGELCELSQASANEWRQRLVPVLREALLALGVMPEREGRQFARAERRKSERADYIIDGTERRRQRPKKSAKQALHYSGKKKMPSDKNVIIVRTSSKRVGYLSPMYAGKTHDKKVADCEQIAHPRQAILHKDTGFQGYEPQVKHSHQPKKSRAASN